MNIKNILSALIITMIVTSASLYAEEAGKISEAVNAYYFNPAEPEVIHPLYVGDSIPSDGIIYLADATSQLTFERNGQTVNLKTPGFYNASGAPAQVSKETQSLIQHLVQNQGEALAQETKSSQAAELQIDDKQAVPSPST